MVDDKPASPESAMTWIERYNASGVSRQQAVLSQHRVRQGFVKARTAQANQIRGLLGEFGLVMPKGITNVR